MEATGTLPTSLISMCARAECLRQRVQGYFIFTEICETDIYKIAIHSDSLLLTSAVFL